MPKVKLSALTDAQTYFRRWVRASETMAGMDDKQLAAKCGVCPRTIASRLKDVDTLTIGELRSIREGLSVPREDMIKRLEELL